MRFSLLRVHRAHRAHRDRPPRPPRRERENRRRPHRPRSPTRTWDALTQKSHKRVCHSFCNQCSRPRPLLGWRGQMLHGAARGTCSISIRLSIRQRSRAGQLQNLCSHCHLASVHPWPWPDLVQSLLPSGPRLRHIVPRVSDAISTAIPLARLRSYRPREVARMDLGVPPRAPAATRAGPQIAQQNRRRRLSEHAIPSARACAALLQPSRSRLKR